MKSIIILSLIALSASVLATPPACLISAVNTEQDPSDFKVVCGDDAPKVQSAIQSLCGSNASAAQSAFIATCSANGLTVASYTATATSTRGGTYIYTTAVYDPNCSCTTTIITSATGASNPEVTGLTTATTGGGASATGTGASSSSTGAAVGGSQNLGSFAAAAIAIAGVVAAL